LFGTMGRKCLSLCYPVFLGHCCSKEFHLSIIYLNTQQDTYMDSLNDKTVFITGATDGLGKRGRPEEQQKRVPG